MACSSPFSPDGTQIAVGSAAKRSGPAEIEVFSVPDGRSLRRLPVPGVPFIGEPSRWSPDGRAHRGAYHEQVIEVDSTTGERLDDLALPGLEGVGQVADGDDGRLLVAGGLPGTAFVSDASGFLLKTATCPP